MLASGAIHEKANFYILRKFPKFDFFLSVISILVDLGWFSEFLYSNKGNTWHKYAIASTVGYGGREFVLGSFGCAIPRTDLNLSGLLVLWLKGLKE